MERKWSLPVILLVLVILLACAICICLVLGIAYFSISSSSISGGTGLSLQIDASPTPVIIRPTAKSTQAAAPNADVPAEGHLDLADAQVTLKQLSDTVVPINDFYDIARRLEGKENISPTLEPPSAPYQVGDQNDFWISNNDTNEFFQVPATLQYVTDHSYFWVENDVRYKQGDLTALAEAFESQIYPTDREFFGSEWTPGVDGDPHIYILYTRGVGEGVAGYFASNDSYNPQVQPYSNGHEMFVFNADNTPLDDEYAYGVLAHEFQHMIHWYRDRNESTWMNEGFSDLAMFLNGYDIGGHDYLYTLDPDLQLNDWPNDQLRTSPHYGASFLFLNYFLGRFGEDATKTLVANPNNDLTSIDETLAELGATNPLTGKTIGADDVFSDWTIASFLQDSSVADGRYTYSLYPNAPQPSNTETIRLCDDEVRTRDVQQYGVDYIHIGCSSPTSLKFEGSTLVHALPEDAHSGKYAFWSNKGDESDMTLTRTFDFTDHSAPLTFTYWTWYDIEKDFDYVYLLASEDGEHWDILHTPSGTSDDPTGANYGWGYNSLSGAGPKWIQESVDLSQYAGKQVQLRFEYITDAAVNGEGLLLDDVAVPETGYSTDFEHDDGGWQADGFVRLQNLLPQSFRLSLITKGDTTSVIPITLTDDNTAIIPLDFGQTIDDAVLVVSGTTRFTRQPATYRFSFQP